MPEEYTFTVYEEDDTTVLFEVGTAADHARPWLKFPTEFVESEVDLLNGQAHIGQINLEVIDPQTGVTQADRGLTALLGTAAGYTACNWRRAVFKCVDPTPERIIIDGVVYGVKLNDSFASFTFAVRDIRERGRKLPMFTRTGTTTIFPRGVLEGYGLLPNQRWLVPPYNLATRRRAIFYGVDNYCFFIPIEIFDKPVSTTIVPAELIFTDKMRDASRATIRDIGGTAKIVFPNVKVGWRLPLTVEWNWLENLQTQRTTAELAPFGAFAIDDIYLFHTGRARYRRDDGEIEDVDAVLHIWGGLQDDGQVRPTVNETEVEIVVVYTGPATKDYPFHWEGTAGELLQAVMDGDFTTDDEGNAIDPRIRYDTASLTGVNAPAALSRPVRLREMEVVPDMREWIEDACKALGLAPFINNDGELVFASAQLPTPGVTLPEITNTLAQAIPGWDHPAASAITQVDISYMRDYAVPAVRDPYMQHSAMDGIATVEQKLSIKPRDESIQRIVGVRILQIKGFLFRALGGSDGRPLSGDVMDEAGAQIAAGRGYEIIDRWAFGGQVGFRRVARSDAGMAAIQPGDWVIDSVSWRPNYLIGERGGQHLAQVVAVRDLNPAWRELRLVDSAPHDSPVGEPVLGVLEEEDDGVVVVPIVQLPIDDDSEARVEYAIDPVQYGLMFRDEFDDLDTSADYQPYLGPSGSDPYYPSDEYPLAGPGVDWWEPYRYTGFSNAQPYHGEDATADGHVYWARTDGSAFPSGFQEFDLISTFSYTPPYVVEAVFRTDLSSGIKHGILFAWDPDEQNGYLVETGAAPHTTTGQVGITLYRIEGGVLTVLGSAGATSAAGTGFVMKVIVDADGNITVRTASWTITGQALSGTYGNRVGTRLTHTFGAITNLVGILAVRVMSSNIVTFTGLATGEKVEVVGGPYGSGGANAIAEVDGVVTYDMQGIAFPRAEFRVYNAANVLQATRSGLEIWGGQTWDRSGTLTQLPPTDESAWIFLGRTDCGRAGTGLLLRDQFDDLDTTQYNGYDGPTGTDPYYPSDEYPAAGPGATLWEPFIDGVANAVARHGYDATHLGHIQWVRSDGTNFPGATAGTYDLVSTVEMPANYMVQGVFRSNWGSREGLLFNYDPVTENGFLVRLGLTAYPGITGYQIIRITNGVQTVLQSLGTNGNEVASAYIKVVVLNGVATVYVTAGTQPTATQVLTGVYGNRVGMRMVRETGDGSTPSSLIGYKAIHATSSNTITFTGLGTGEKVEVTNSGFPAAITADANGVVRMEIGAGQLPMTQYRILDAANAVLATRNISEGWGGETWDRTGTRLDGSGGGACELRTPPMPAGATVWARARGEKVGRRPSNWVDPERIALSDIPRILSATVVVNEDGTVDIAWDGNDATAGLRVYWAVHGTMEPPAVLGDDADYDASILETGLSGVLVPVGSTITVDFEPYSAFTAGAAAGTAGPITRKSAVYPDRDLPRIKSATVWDQIVEIIGTDAVRSIKLERTTGGTWSKHIDGGAHAFNVAGPDDAGNAGISGNTYWSVRATVYDDTKAEVDSTTQSHTWEGTVYIGTGAGAGTPQFDILYAVAPATGDDDATLWIRCTSAGSGHTVRIYERFTDAGGESAWTNVTGSLTPSLSTPPTTLTSYTRDTAHTHDLGWPDVTYEWRCEILDGSSNVVAQQIVTAVYPTSVLVPS